MLLPQGQAAQWGESLDSCTGPLLRAQHCECNPALLRPPECVRAKSTVPLLFPPLNFLLSIEPQPSPPPFRLALCQSPKGSLRSLFGRHCACRAGVTEEKAWTLQGGHPKRRLQRGGGASGLSIAILVLILLCRVQCSTSGESALKRFCQLHGPALWTLLLFVPTAGNTADTTTACSHKRGKKPRADSGCCVVVVHSGGRQHAVTFLRSSYHGFCHMVGFAHHHDRNLAVFAAAFTSFFPSRTNAGHRTFLHCTVFLDPIFMRFGNQHCNPPRPCCHDPSAQCYRQFGDKDLDAPLFLQYEPYESISGRRHWQSQSPVCEVSVLRIVDGSYRVGGWVAATFQVAG